MGFVPTKAEPDIWMRDKGDHHEHLARHVDDLAIASRDPKSITDELSATHRFKLKGTGPISYHLGCDFFCDSQNVLCQQPKRHIQRMMDSYQRMFGELPSMNVRSPLKKGDHPELDTSPECDIEGIKQHQSIIGAAQWIISLGRLDLTTAIMTLSKFRSAPREGHLKRIKRVFGCLRKMSHGTVRCRTGIPDCSDLVVEECDWEKLICGDVKELIPDDAPPILGKPVVMTTCVNANLLHDLTTGRAVAGVVHVFNQTIVDSCSERQPVVETATHGSEFMAARMAAEQILEPWNTLQCLGVEVQGKTCMFGDNQAVVTRSAIPTSKLNKRWVLLSFHRVREAIAAGSIAFVHVFGDSNLADLLSKNWGCSQVWPLLKTPLFWEGDTVDIDDE